MDLKTRLVGIAEVWVSQWQRTDDVTLRTLGRRSVGNALLFERDDMALSTAQRLLEYLFDHTNWPAGLVPRETAERLADLMGFEIEPEHVYHVTVAA